MDEWNYSKDNVTHLFMSEFNVWVPENRIRSDELHCIRTATTSRIGNKKYWSSFKIKHLWFGSTEVSRCVSSDWWKLLGLHTPAHYCLKGSSHHNGFHEAALLLRYIHRPRKHRYVLVLQVFMSVDFWVGSDPVSERKRVMTWISG